MSGAPDGRDAADARAFEQARAQIARRYGAGALMRLGDRAARPVEAIPTGAVGLDLALGTGGIPRGRVIEVFGPESSGKTTLALHVVANAQKAGGAAAYVDAEHALDPAYAARIGVDTDALWVSQPDYGEQALDIVETLVASGAVRVIVVDSVAALVPKVELMGEMGESHVGTLARLMSQALRKLTAQAARTGTAILFLNQVRERIGVLFGNPETTPGGRALKFHASVRLEVRRLAAIKGPDGEALGTRIKVKVVKNKLAPPFRAVELELRFASGLDAAASALDVAIERGLLKRAGAWLQLDGEPIARGRDEALAWLGAHPEALGRLEAALRGEARDAAG